MDLIEKYFLNYHSAILACFLVCAGLFDRIDQSWFIFAFLLISLWLLKKFQHTHRAVKTFYKIVDAFCLMLAVLIPILFLDKIATIVLGITLYFLDSLFELFSSIKSLIIAGVTIIIIYLQQIKTEITSTIENNYCKCKSH